jgi:hypothetical protein
MSKSFQFRLRTLLLAIVPVAVIAVPVGYFLRRPHPVPVSITVTVNGKPINGQVEFFPSDQATGHEVAEYTRMKATFLVLVYPGYYSIRISDFISAGMALDMTPSDSIVHVTRKGPNTFTFKITTLPNN